MVIPINTRTLESVDYTGGISDTDKTTHLSGSTDMPDADAENLQALLAELGLPDLPVSSSALSLDTLLNAIGDDVRRQACRDGVASLELKGEQQAEINEKELQEIADRLEEMKKINEKKAKILYDFLDSSKLFKGTVVPEDRSLMNVPFVTGSDELDAKFVAEAKKAGFVNLKGHRSVGGMRASIYNAMPTEGVVKLVEFMKKFEEENA